MFGFILLFAAFTFNMGAEVQESGDLARIKKEIKNFTLKPMPGLENMSIIVNR